ncbi:2-C-methyl-D-erythritol 4-phosphate cytidylyltransferase [Clostridium botulinum]|uniref:IspD/TarI family cytidylyltransferase n=1 Tax=Clostridium botulinum TaxID=1491 RepID=UPI000379B1D8|nr:2-C-methyl-D-erythritol 4-phosphate cytidylyltransferase [Clostridium botulinum]MBN1036685.1 2-C-methyl-D-erythritol 4-phosphate cytidylyltransferase [Clostridium botulinum]MBY6809939.1 2-C-methyl-D-erythritol 4-phosphate cytidylyltransferase [Clostridium botulinum]MBY6823595.1 2-C-methyl-D-erythritol 4-phosphate cytidylyltransferase [Clostridium botulinum]MBY6834206.1 2-C-methyl-D-erythritol 4-phosphate cytidylyltransferase [Clostridium botulinum]MBY6929462.1 2-C-methyl-D-erythritol 4-phos
MIYAEILAGGKGTRMGNTDVPKQFLKLGNKPIIIHTIEKFLLNAEINKILVVVSGAWVNTASDLIKKFIPNNSKIDIVQGGTTRTETVMNGIKHIEKEYGLNDDDIIVTHDAVRPFLSYRIIEENIKYAKEYGATDTVIPAIDTIVVSENNNTISDIPVRDRMYQGQTPQSFNIKLLLDTYKKLSQNEKEVLTDAAKIMVLKGVDVKLVDGEYYNIKITTQYDLLLANSILEGMKKNDK